MAYKATDVDGDSLNGASYPSVQVASCARLLERPFGQEPSIKREGRGTLRISFLTRVQAAISRDLAPKDNKGHKARLQKKAPTPQARIIARLRRDTRPWPWDRESGWRLQAKKSHKKRTARDAPAYGHRKRQGVKTKKTALNPC